MSATSSDRTPAERGDQPAASDAEDAAPVLDIALYIGGLLGLYGVILLIYGAVGSPDNQRSLGHPFDLWWGGVMLALGLVVGGAGVLAKRARRAAE